MHLSPLRGSCPLAWSLTAGTDGWRWLLPLPPAADRCPGRCRCHPILGQSHLVSGNLGSERPKLHRKPSVFKQARLPVVLFWTAV